MVRINSERHQIYPVPLADHLRRHIPDYPGLFVYRHTETGNWVVGLWYDRDEGLAHEVAMIGKDLSAVTREFVQEVKKTLTRRVTMNEAMQVSEPHFHQVNDNLAYANDERDFWLNRWGNKAYAY